MTTPITITPKPTTIPITNNTSLPITNRITTTSSSTPTTTMAQPPSLMYSHHHQPKQFYQQQQQQHQSGSAVTNPPSSRDPRSSYQELANSKTAEEVSHHNHLVQRFDSAIKKDQISVFQPDYRTHFRSYQDAVSRLLPYHIFDYPQEDMKANDQINELDAIMDKFDELIKKEAKLPYSIHTNLCEKLIYENEKAKTATLREECFQLAELLKKTPR
ncbi:15478_t:CDS:2 [Entrophospora sp. SA101]|nr:15478_t:CDS:2 [Entrophospora sp. SA101]